MFLFISLFLFVSIFYSTKKDVKYAKSGVGPSPLKHGSALAVRGQGSGLRRSNAVSSTQAGVSSQEHIELSIYKIKGQKIKVLDTFLNGSLGTSGEYHPEPAEGRHSVIWNGNDDHNQPVPSGIYLYKLQAGKQVLTRKMILIK